MKYFTLFPLQGHWGKIAGAVVAGAAALAGAVIQLVGTAPFSPFVAADKQLLLTVLLLAFGLMMMTLSKERVDDERVQQIRYTSFRGLVSVQVLACFSLFFPFLFDPEVSGPLVEREDAVPAAMLLLVFPQLVYQVLFHIGLQHDPHWAYNDLGAEENIRKNPRFFLFYVLFLAAMAVLSFVLKQGF